MPWPGVRDNSHAYPFTPLNIWSFRNDLSLRHNAHILLDGALEDPVLGRDLRNFNDWLHHLQHGIMHVLLRNDPRKFHYPAREHAPVAPPSSQKHVLENFLNFRDLHIVNLSNGV